MPVLDVLRYLVIPFLSAIVGAVLIHVATKRRDLENDRRRQRVEYLLSAYRALAGAVNRDIHGRERGEALEDALDLVVLLGTPEQIEMAIEAIHSFATTPVPADDLLASLRTALRDELGLPADGLTEIPVLRSPKHDEIERARE